MKALIWILTIVVATVLNVLIGELTGYKAGYLVFYLAVYFVAKGLCNAWDEHNKNKVGLDRIEQPKDINNVDIPSIPVTQIEPQINTILSQDAKIEFCRKCGAKLLDKSSFCRRCGAEVPSTHRFNNSTPVSNESLIEQNIGERDPIQSVLCSQEFEKAYRALSGDQKERFFLQPDRKVDAARVVYSMKQFVDTNVKIEQLLEIYFIILSRAISRQMPPERIAVTLNMRYSDILNMEQQYWLIEFSQAHMNGKDAGFYIKSYQDIERIKAMASVYQDSLSTEDTISAESDYGTSAENPIRVQSLPAEYTYLDKLVYEKGVIKKIDRLASVSNQWGDLLDCFVLTVIEDGTEKNINLYLDGYGKMPSRTAPKGFRLK